MVEWLAQQLALLGQSLWPQPSAVPLSILQADERQLVIQGNAAVFCFDARQRCVRVGTRRKAAFDDIRCVIVRHHRDSDDRPEHWSVTLQVRGFLADVHLGWSQDDVDASILGARLARFLGKPVRAW
ncbi:hypothetical protein QRD43_06550 [Pelomonas sp. APW6]|uniref:Uncharacterized protein n=1 Tax=Roseateles subflavus TaxID=3053353 RepID=A0ABT7LFD6_9BURK|nr:hypothetical protein [Pelomonas sp. APW6]MDL5031564.1 hypothetical protein [Pelomonas sp. APW6]